MCDIVRFGYQKDIIAYSEQQFAVLMGVDLKMDTAAQLFWGLSDNDKGKT